MSYYNGTGLLSEAGVGQASLTIGPAPGTERRSAAWTVLGIASLVATPVLAYHGYKRNNSIPWAIVWGIFGAAIWPVMVPVAFAQGFARPRTGLASNRRRRRRSR